MTIPRSCASIGLGAFSGCKSLKSVNVPKGCRIAEGAFSESQVILV